MRLFIPKQLWMDKLTNTISHKFELLIILDNESIMDHNISHTIINTFPSDLQSIFDLRIEFEDPFLPKESNQSGHDRQQWSMFYADQYMPYPSYSKYIAFMDTDIVFKTIALPNLMFDDDDFNIPKVLGSPQIAYMMLWGYVPYNTYQWFNQLEPFMCMNYFPFIMHVKHFQELRETVMEIHGVTDFMEVLEKLGLKAWSQFNVFCGFMWYYRRSEYKFVIFKQWLNKLPYIHDKCHWKYHKKNQWPSHKKAIDYEYFVNRYIHNDPSYTQYISLKPTAHLTSHVKYIGVDYFQHAFYAMRFGYCFITHFRNKTICDQHVMRGILDDIAFVKFRRIPLELSCFDDLSQINPYLFEFEGRHSMLYHPMMMETMRNHYYDIDEYLVKYNHTWTDLDVVMTNFSSAGLPFKYENQNYTTMNMSLL